MEFCKTFNAQTQHQEGLIIPAVITVYADRSFSFVTKTPPAAVLLKQAAGIAKASKEPNREKVGKVTSSQVTGDSEDEDAGSECGYLGRGGKDYRGNGPKHGH